MCYNVRQESTFTEEPDATARRGSRPRLALFKIENCRFEVDWEEWRTK
jgi:hypothetical protein